MSDAPPPRSFWRDNSLSLVFGGLLLAIGTMAVFAIYLRERGSPESKEVGAPHAVTQSSD